MTWREDAEKARNGINIEELSNHPDWRVRIEVAKQGYKPNKFLGDEEYCVREIAKKILEEDEERK